MTQEEFDSRLKVIKAQEGQYGVKIDMYGLHDKDHLDSFWYGGEVGQIIFPDGYTVTISAIGDNECNGHFEGVGDFRFSDKANGGTAFPKLGAVLNDDMLNDDEEPNYIIWHSYNWFEANVITPDGKYVDMSGLANNVISGNYLECFEVIVDYCDLIKAAEKEITERELGKLPEYALEYNGIMGYSMSLADHVTSKLNSLSEKETELLEAGMKRMEGIESWNNETILFNRSACGEDNNDPLFVSSSGEIRFPKSATKKAGEVMSLIHRLIR